MKRMTSPAFLTSSKDFLILSSKSPRYLAPATMLEISILTIRFPFKFSGTSPATISGIIADEMAIGMINQKTTAVRIIPVIGKDVGEVVEFGGLLGYAPIMPVNKFDCAEFVNRGGRIPAPIHSFKN